MHSFEELVHIFGEFVHIFARKRVSRTSKQVWRNLGPLWQPGVYNDTKIVKLFSATAHPPTHPHHHRPPSFSSRFRVVCRSFSSRSQVVFESILSRNRQSTQKRLEIDRKTARNLTLWEGGVGGGGDESGGGAVAEKQFTMILRQLLYQWRCCAPTHQHQ